LQGDQFLRKDLHATDIGGSEAVVDLDVATLDPTQTFKRRPERRQRLHELWIALGPADQYADPPHLLGTRRNRPRRRSDK
jgi:hypothetical protein